jgi:hypothetical protein
MKGASLQVKVRQMAMKTTQRARHFVMTSLLTVLAPIVLFAPQAYAETYVAGQMGLTVPSIGSGLSNSDLTTTTLQTSTGTLNFPPGTTLSNESLKSSLLLGAKLGHFFARARWLGVETEIFRTTPHIKEQSIVITIPSTPSSLGCTAPGTPVCPTFSVPGSYFQVITWAPVNLVFRYPGTRFQPYVAVGPGVFFGRLKDPSITSGPTTQSDTTLGLNAQLGMRYYITRHVAAFGELKYNYARFNFSENDNYFGFRSTYSPLHFVLGLSYSF